MEKSRSKNVNNSRVTHSVDPAVIEENAKKAPDGDALYREAFAKKLNELLEEKQIDQKTLAAKTKISETNISNYRNATTTIKLPALAKIARELGVSVDYLSGNSDIESINLDVQDNYDSTIMDTYYEEGTVALESGITYEIQVRQDSSIGSYNLNIEKE